MVIGRSLALRHLAWRQAGLGFLATILALPVIGYSFRVFAADPVYAYWSGAQNTQSGSPVSVAWSYAFLLALAVPGIRAVLKQRRNAGWMFLLSWFVLQPLLLYAPTAAQRRLIIGWPIPLSILIAYGLATYVQPFLARRFPQQGHRLWLTFAASVVLFTTVTYGLLIVWNVASVMSRQPDYFYSPDQLAAANWLEAHATYADGVLASFSSSTFLPAQADVRVHAGHHNETAWVGERTAEIAQFFRGTTSDVWRRDFLERFGMTYVLHSLDERALGDFDPARAPYLSRVFEAGEVRVYQVAPR
jgi:hypothetical protein